VFVATHLYVSNPPPVSGSSIVASAMLDAKSSCRYSPVRQDSPNRNVE